MKIKIDQKITGFDVVSKKKEEILKRPTCLVGKTIKITNVVGGYNLYITVNYHENKPFEVFLDSSHTDSAEWVKGMSRVISAGLRSHDSSLDLEFYAKQLMKVHSDQGYHTGGKGGWVAGVVYHIGKVLLDVHKGAYGISEPTEKKEEPEEDAPDTRKPGKECPSCHEFAVVKIGGCEECTACDWRGECG